MYYFDDNILDTLKKTVLKMPVDINIIYTKDVLEFIEKYDTNSFDIVLIDENKNNPQNLLFEILKKNSLQRVITLHEFFDCYIDKGCNYCKSNYFVNRVQKPLVEDDIKKILINKYECDEYLHDILLAKLKYIEKNMLLLYNNYFFDVESFSFVCCRSNYIVNNFIYLKEQLDEQNINYFVTESNDIKILR